MKTTITSLALLALITSSAFAALKSPLPEFKNEKQLAEWRAEKASQSNTRAATQEPAFYTGRPYLASSGSYAFKYRAYNPEIARWTSEDPSGFPDGANGNFYAPTPTNEIDLEGLNKTVILKRFYEDDISNYYSHDQLRIDTGMDITLILNIRGAAFQEFKNSMAQAYSVGDQITKGPQVSVLTGMVANNSTLRPGYPRSSITSITFADTSPTFAVGFTFNCYIKSTTTYSYE